MFDDKVNVNHKLTKKISKRIRQEQEKDDWEFFHYEPIQFTSSDSIYLFFSQVLCNCKSSQKIPHIFDKEKKPKSRKELLVELYKEGEQRLEKEFGIERIIYCCRQIS